MPDNLYFGGGGDTFFTPTAIAILVTAIVLIVIIPRRYAIVPLLMAGLLLPMEINLFVWGLHFGAYRLLLLAGLGASVLGLVQCNRLQLVVG
jgi:hypothetical protein